MKKERKEALLNSFPTVPQWCMDHMKGRGAMNFVIFLIKQDGGELFARCYHRYANGKIAERQRYVFAKDGRVRYGTDYSDKWHIRSDFREPVFCQVQYGKNFDNSYAVLNHEVIKNSCMKYAPYNQHSSLLFVEFLGLYCKHPNVEYIIKSNYSHLIHDEYYGFYGTQPRLEVNPHINWKSNNLLKMLGLTHSEFKLLKGQEGIYDRYIRFKEAFPKLQPEDLLKLANYFGYEVGTADMFSSATGLSPIRLVKYLTDNKVSALDFRDYIHQCNTLNYNMHDTAISMPHHFQQTHERLSEMIKYKASEEARKKFRQHYDERRKLEFTFGNLFIRQPESINEIVAEGKELHHCVGGYAERHANGKLHIMFIRTADKPDVPYYTMEVSTEGKIIQVRGNRNCDPTPEVAELVQMYKEHLNTIFEKKERKSA